MVMLLITGQIEKNPILIMNKPQIIEWLRNKSIDCSEDLLKAELLRLVQVNTPPIRYLIAEIEQHPIELICAQVKGVVARNNITFELSDVWELLENY